jgi:putative DNA primase/helicase
MATAKLPEDKGGGRVFVRVKSNVGPDGGGFRYELRQGDLDGEHRGIIASRVEWGEPIDGTAREILADAEQETKAQARSERSEASGWLRERIADAGGEMDRRDILNDAKSAGFAERTIDRARKDAGVVAEQTGFGKDRRSTWRIAAEANPASIQPIPPTQKVGANGGNGGGDGGSIDNGEHGEVF